VIAHESEICCIDGYQGILSYRGYNIHMLADNAIFKEVIFLLWNGWLPKPGELAQLKHDLAAARLIPAAEVEFLRAAGGANAMDVLRTAASMLSLYGPDGQDMPPRPTTARRWG
jgi:citrate synthase